MTPRTPEQIEQVIARNRAEGASAEGAAVDDFIFHMTLTTPADAAALERLVYGDEVAELKRDLEGVMTVEGFYAERKIYWEPDPDDGQRFNVLNGLVEDERGDNPLLCYVSPSPVDRQRWGIFMPHGWSVGTDFGDLNIAKELALQVGAAVVADEGRPS